MQPQARSDGSQLAGPVLATQRKPAEGSTVQGKEGPALPGLACPPCPRVSPRSGCRAHSEERTTVGTEPPWAPSCPRASRCVALRAHTPAVHCASKRRTSSCPVTWVQQQLTPPWSTLRGPMEESRGPAANARGTTDGPQLNNSSGSAGLRARTLWKCSPSEEPVVVH